MDCEHLKSWLLHIIYLLELAMCEKFCEACNTNTSHIKIEQEYALWKYQKQNENDDAKMVEFVVAMLSPYDHTFGKCQKCGTVNITGKKSLF